MSNSIIFQRSIKPKIDSWLFKGKIILIYGPRQVGKTTLTKQIINEHKDTLYLNCELQSVASLLESMNIHNIRNYIGNAKLVVFDEAQKILRIGDILKLLIDTYPEIQYIATGSSSFDLANSIAEPLTGRNVKFTLFPLSIIEIAKSMNKFEIDEAIPQLLVFGNYPDIVLRPDNEKLQLLDELSSDYLFQDVLKFEQLRKPLLLTNLLKALALQIGQEVSVRELSNLLKVSVETIQRYLTLLEKTFVVFSLTSFSRNLRNEIAKGKKYYFYDLGIRNSLLQNFTLTGNRNDIGQLWENFCLLERLKANQAADRRVNSYFWRTYSQKEIDLIEESGGKLNTFEFKWNPRSSAKIPAVFAEAYPGSSYQIISKNNLYEFVDSEF